MSDVVDRIEAAIELLDVRVSSAPRLAMLEITECVGKLRRASELIARDILPGQCAGGQNCTCCCSGCDCGCRDSCPQWITQAEKLERRPDVL